MGKAPNFGKQRQQRRRLAVPWGRNRPAAVEIEFIATEEVAVHLSKVDPDVLLQQARERMAATLAWRLAAGDRIERIDARVIQAAADRAGIVATAQVLQAIGQPGPSR